MKDYYAILGVSREATQEEIKQAYRRLAREYHPDRHPGDKAIEERFKEINEAYAVLSDPEKRARYDRGLLEGQSFGEEDLFDLFAQVFGWRWSSKTSWRERRWRWPIAAWCPARPAGARGEGGWPAPPAGEGGWWRATTGAFSARW
jgi:curved DNA-binding protein CbpA